MQPILAVGLRKSTKNKTVFESFLHNFLVESNQKLDDYFTFEHVSFEELESEKPVVFY